MTEKTLTITFFGTRGMLCAKLTADQDTIERFLCDLVSIEIGKTIFKCPKADFFNIIREMTDMWEARK